MAASEPVLLFAEDNPEDRIPVARFLRAKGYRVVEVISPQQAKESLMEAEFDVIILDLVMPEDNPRGGEEILQFMHDNGIETPVILATAWGYDGPAQRAKSAYSQVVRCVLTKTFDSSELVAAINVALAG